MSKMQMRHKLCETVLSQALNYEHQLYERIMVNYHTVKMRRGADRNFEQWIRKKIAALKQELTALEHLKK